PSLTPPMAGVEAIARDENNTADAGGTVDWPDLEWPAEDATAPVADAEEARQDAADPVPGVVPDAVTEVVPDAVPDAVPEIATASAPPQDAPADPPLTHLPEEAEVPAEDRVAFATETMAEILVSQGRHEDARQLYEQIMNRRPQDVGVRQRMESLMQATKGPAANVPQATGIPMRELMSRILAYTPPGSAGSVTPPDAIQAQGPTTTGDARAAAARTIAGMMAESEQDAERAARTFADAAAALGDPAVAQQLAATVESQPEPISAVLARVAAESPEPAHGAGTSQRITPRQAPTFSFDQFFRDAMPEEETPAPPDVASTGAGEAALPQADDDDGFRAWLDGLRKS
ncbi:MAG TPA: hypothetical protein VKZ41_04030, partial [Gemmatimonadales bacterium]|nr:hypothetical protein [Gemmatimonadales bacterium]